MARRSKTKPQHNGCAAQGVLTPPAHVVESITRITSEDRRWFEEHPDAEFRTRLAAENEFWPVFDSGCVSYVIVAQVRLGWRLRAPVVRSNLPESERIQ
jgi:hypothetical protein